MTTSSTPEEAPKEAPAKEPAPKKINTIHRFQIGVNVIVQTVVIVALVLMVNYMSFRHFKRWDFSSNHQYELSSQTKNLLKNLPKPVKAVIFFSNGADIPISQDVSNLLHEYEYASNGKFKTEIVDPYRSLSRAQELSAKYKFGANENILILDFDGKSKFVNAADMADIEAPDQMAQMMGQTQPKVKDFKGEQAITSALIELTEGKPNKVYFVSGHGEPDLKSKDLQIFNEALKRQNIQIDPLELLNVESVPEDARTLIIDGPKYDYTDLEIKRLNDFWEKKGRLFVLLNPFAKTPHLTGWLNEQGIQPQDDRIIRTGTFLQMDDEGKPQLKSGVIGNASFVVIDSHTSITKDIDGVSKQLLGATQSLNIDQSRAAIGKLHIAPILQSAEGFWGDTDPTNQEEKKFFDPKKDHMGPLNMALAVEKGGVESVKMDDSRLVVVGNADLLSNNAYRLSDNFSAPLFTNILNWLLNREDVIGIPPKEKKMVTITLDEKQLRNIAIGVMILVPGIVALFGLIVWSQRRS